jgi:hypothetical protein
MMSTVTGLDDDAGPGTGAESATRAFGNGFRGAIDS